jgi:hypothetical protein
MSYDPNEGRNFFWTGTGPGGRGLKAHSFVFHKEIKFVAIHGGLRVQCCTEREGVKNGSGPKWAGSNLGGKISQ